MESKPQDLDDLIIKFLQKIKFLNEEKKEEYLKIFNQSLESDIKQLDEIKGVE